MATTDILVDLTRDEIDEDERRQFDAALERINNGTYGLCVECARPIERARIDLSPLAERCARCDGYEAHRHALAA